MCRSYEKILDVGTEPTIAAVEQAGSPTKELYEQQRNEELKKAENRIDNAWYRYISWFGGMLVAFIPAVAYPFYRFVNTDDTFSNVLFLVFCQSQIIFIAVSMCITAINDAVSDSSDRFLKYWKIFIWALIVLGALLFGAISISEETQKTHSEVKTFWINVVLLVTTVILGSIPYIVSIIKAHKEKRAIMSKGGEK